MNPVSKIRQIVEHITDDVLIANKLMGAISNELTAEEIDILWRELKLHLNALNDDCQQELF